MTRSIAGWKLPPAERDRLLERFEPRYAELVADHVTLRFGTDEDTPLPAAHSNEIIGKVDGAGSSRFLELLRQVRCGCRTGN